ncbi:trafficking protein particle complex subunit 8 [Phtheirospermum japonicum]|uniref:Trafficking protein particle complex subunit 8 n=1 Tax=Phtheirospermum japonicum TaxID=374723 RepID=A0A830CNP4_9LAMI|nr:trafficking protein particle complex subunit 8 [Phtheirospermum japonicum]
MSDPANTKLGRMLLDEITPVVMVLRTPLVDESCRKNGLSLIEMLTPFSNFNNIDVPVRTASDQPYRLRKFKLRLFYASEIRQPDIEAAKERLKQVINCAGDKDISDLCTDPPDIDSLVATSEQEIVPSWFQNFNKELVDTVSFSEHEAFDHPVACLIAVSSKDKDPIDKFVDLFNTNQLPSLLNDGAMDPKIMKYFLLVHDNQDGMLEGATGVLTEMRSTFGPNDCRLLCINSSANGMEEHQENPWASYKNSASNNKQLGCFLNMDDIEELRNTVHDLSSKHIIPHMELKIRVLNQQVSATRKGFRNQIKNLWWRKGKDDAPENPSGAMYTYSSTESQIRVLGDYAFMLRDYELALSNYRLISTDYKLDKAWKHYAGVQEMMGMAYFMLDQSRKDAEYCMENAFSTYSEWDAHRLGTFLKSINRQRTQNNQMKVDCYTKTLSSQHVKVGDFLQTLEIGEENLAGKIGPSGGRNVTRCGIWWAEMLKARGQFKDAASVYFRITGEEPLHSAVMLEQASYCFLLSTPTMLRKYGFHLVLSGDLYKKSDQIKHAIRTYRGALLVFKGTSWNHIRDHVHFYIGRWYAFLGMFDEAIKHILEVLTCGHQSKPTQELFLREFFRIVQETGKTFEVLRLQLPVINFPSIKIVFEDHRTYAPREAASVRESVWQMLEGDMIPSLSVMKSNWLDSQPKFLPKKYKESNVCVAGEAIKMDISFTNPLQIPVSISNISLICKHSPQYDETESDADTSLNSDKELRTLSVSGDFSLDTSLFTLSEVDISMQGGETMLAAEGRGILYILHVQLTVTPKIEGTLKVVGVRWKLSGSVIGIYNFHSDIARKKVAKGKRKQKQEKNNLQFLVIKSLPRLEGVIHNLPKTVYAGELRRLTLELRNPSKISVKGLKTGAIQNVLENGSLILVLILILQCYQWRKMVNLKMRMSHPRFLKIAAQEIMNSEFPSCLRKQESSSQSCMQVGATEAADSVFVFPETAASSWELPLKWPLWFRAAAAGSISLYITIYYEMEDGSSVITYRTLRMHYNLEVLPSLEVSFQTSPCPSRLQEFLVRMDVVNNTSSESFRVHQLSCVGDQWELALLRPTDSVVSFEVLMSGQAMSCFFKLKYRRRQGSAEKKTSSSLSKSGRADVGLVDSDYRRLYDTSISPFSPFHHFERLDQERHEQCESYVFEEHSCYGSLTVSQGHGSSVDFILIFESHSESDSGPPRPAELFSHHSIVSNSPVWWLMDGPRSVRHDFSATFCEINLSMTVYNSSEDVVSVRINTLDYSTSVVNFLTTSTSVSGNEVGWHDTSNLNDIKVASDVTGTRSGKALSPESVSPFIWSGSSSTKFNLDPLTSVVVPLQISLFSPGTFDLSNYSLQWDIVSSSDGGGGNKHGSRVSSGTCQGHSYHITVLQKEI